ncbi:hypothetical protein AAVH_37134, partial [Aphelenchoides avenae]
AATLRMSSTPLIALSTAALREKLRSDHDEVGALHGTMVRMVHERADAGIDSTC